MLTEDKFFDKAEGFALYPTTDKKYLTFDELKDSIKDNQTDKDDKLIILYASDVDSQHSYIEQAKSKGYKVLLLDSPIIGHLIQKLEGKKEKVSFTVDRDLYLWFRTHVKDERTSMSALVNKYIMELKQNKERPKNILKTTPKLSD